MEAKQSAGAHSRVVFKSYNQHQLMLLPPSLEEMIDPKHPVRVVNRIVDSIDLKPILDKCPKGGASRYHPAMLLKVLTYSYMTNTYSSRKMEQALKENIHFMWLAGQQRPDHNTLARFRSGALKGIFEEIFSQVVLLLYEEGLIDLKVVYTDGTKIESVANRYTFVWAKAIDTHREKIRQQLLELLEYGQKVAEEELKSLDAQEFNEINPEKVKQAVEQIDHALQHKPVTKKVKQKLAKAKKDWPQKLAEYEEKEAVLDGRNSYSKTDTDATFMRMKDDHLQTGQLKPAYNWQQSTNGQFIVCYTVHQNRNDTLTLKPHLEQMERQLGQLPAELCADAGYGSEENYELLESKGIEAYVKYNTFHKEDTKKWQLDPSRVQNLHYNAEEDRFYCPMGQPMDRVETREKRTETGFVQQVAGYQARNCEGCPMRGVCHKATGNRKIVVNHKLNRHRQQARERLESERGLHHRSQRSQDVEPVFGHIKSNRNFDRLMLKGLDKVKVEIGLLSLAHNLKKCHTVSIK